MTDELQAAIAEVSDPSIQPWRAVDFFDDVDFHYGPDNEPLYTAIATILNAVVSGAFVPAPAVPDIRPLAEFGHGKWVVDTGTHYGKPAVFIGPNPEPGPVGEKTKPEHQLPQGCLKEGEFFLTFPTDEQAVRVADALVNAAPAVPDDAAGLLTELREASWSENLTDTFQRWDQARQKSADLIEAQAAELARLTALRAAQDKALDSWGQRALSAETENAKLREALRPFVKYIHDEYRTGNGRYVLASVADANSIGGGWLEAEDLRRARAALTQPTGGSND